MSQFQVDLRTGEQRRETKRDETKAIASDWLR